MGGISGTLSWSPPATGAPESYQVLKDGVPVGTVSGSKTSTSVSDLPRDGVTSLVVVPLGAGGAPGPASSPLAAGIPSDPGSELTLTAAPASSTSANLSWNRPRGGASGMGSPASYAVLKNGQQIATVPASGAELNTFTATGLQPNAPAVFSVVPLAPSGSPTGPASQQVPVTPSSAAGGASGPFAGARAAAPSNLQLNNVSSGLMGGSSGTLSWNHPATGAPQSYQVLKEGVPVGTVSGSKTSTSVSDLPRDGVTSLVVVPLGAGGVPGPASAPLSAGIPSDPGSNIVLTAAPDSASGSSAKLSWNRPRGAAYGPISQYGVLKNGQQIATVPASGGATNAFTATGLQPGAPAVFSVVPLSPAGVPSGPGSLDVPLSPFAGAGRGVPSAPSNLQLTNVSSGLMGGISGTLSWSPPATGAPESYQVLKDGVPVGTVSGSKTSTSVSDLPRDGVTSLVVVPLGAGGAPGPASANLSWNRPRGGASGMGSPASYAVLKNGQQIATVPASGAELNTFTATGLQPNAPAVFSVVPLAPSGSPTGPASQQVPVTPSSAAGGASGPFAGARAAAPSNLQLNNVSAGMMGGSSGTLSWNHPATGAPQSYQVLKDGVPVGTVSGSKTSTSVSDLPRDGVTSLVVVPLGPGGVPGPASAPLSAGIPSDPGSNIVLTAAPDSASGSSAKLSWNRPRGAAYGPISQYGVLKNGQQIATVPASGGATNAFTATGLHAQPGAPAVFSVVPLSPAGVPSGPVSPQVPLLSLADDRGGFQSSTARNTSFGSARRRKPGQPYPDSDGADTYNIGPSPVPEAPYLGFSGSLPSAPMSTPSAGQRSSAPDEKAPSDLLLTAAPGSGSSGKLSWRHPAAGPPSTYAVVANGKMVAAVPGAQTSASVPAPQAGGSAATYRVVPMTAVGNAETASFPLAVAAPPRDASRGVIALTAAPTSSDGSSVLLKWSTPSGKEYKSSRLQGYSVSVNGNPVATLPPSGGQINEYPISNIPAGAKVEITPITTDGPSPAGRSAPVVVPSSDGVGDAASKGLPAPHPSAPSNVQLTNVDQGIVSNTTGTLTWEHPSTGAPTHYMVLKDGLPVGTVPGSQTAFNFDDLPTGQMTAFSVVPVSSSGALGPSSHPVNSLCLPCKLAAMLGR
eukprot:tig00020685_g12962.t1